MKGGYYLLDAKKVELTETDPQPVAGIFAEVKKALATGKPIVAENLLYGAAPVSPVNCFGWYLSTTEIVLVSATLHLHVKSDNTVTVLDVVSTS